MAIVEFYDCDADLVGAVAPSMSAPPRCALSAQEIVASFPADPVAPGDARRLLIDALRRRGCERMSVDAAALVLSELASNVVRHVGSSFSVQATIEDSVLRLAVADAGTSPGEGAMTVCATHGLGVVDALALRWGVEGARGGKVVWAELAV